MTESRTQQQYQYQNNAWQNVVLLKKSYDACPCVCKNLLVKYTYHIMDILTVLVVRTSSYQKKLLGFSTAGDFYILLCRCIWILT